METENGKRFVTNQYALARHGLAEKEWPFIVLSNSPLTEVRQPSAGKSPICL